MKTALKLIFFSINGWACRGSNFILRKTNFWISKNHKNRIHKPWYQIGVKLPYFLSKCLWITVRSRWSDPLSNPTGCLAPLICWEKSVKQLIWIIQSVVHRLSVEHTYVFAEFVTYNTTARPIRFFCECVLDLFLCLF